VSSILTYLEPKEVLLRTATVLKGTFDPAKVATVSVVAEDKYPLSVELNRAEGRWQVDLPNGLTAPGIRWLRLKAMDSSGRELDNQQAYITVSEQPMTVADSLSLEVLHDTFFKATPAPSTTLSDRHKAQIPKGRSFGVSRYSVEGDRVKIELNIDVEPLGRFGYFYKPHVQLVKAEQTQRVTVDNVPDPPPGFCQLWVAQTTKIKTKPEDSSQLSAHQQAELLQGQTFLTFGHTSFANHFRIMLRDPIPGFGQIGYVYKDHVKLKKDGEWIEYNPNATNLSILKTTVIKKRPVDSSTLSAADRYTLPIGSVYGVVAYSSEAGHLKVSLSENLPGFGNTGYLYADFVRLLRGETPLSAVSDRTPSPEDPLTYTGPKEVLVKQAVTLTGNFDPQSISAIAVVAEDKYPLKVELDRDAGTWRVVLSNGFNTAGLRWLRLRGADSNNQLVSSEIIYITVSTQATTVGEPLRLRVEQDTWFKVAPFDSQQLADDQKVMVKGGTTFTVSRYGLVDGHLKVNLDPAVNPVGSFGYFYEGHVELTKGEKVLRFDIEDVPDTNLTAKMLVTRTTFIKARPVDSSMLNASQKADLKLGTTYGITGYACTEGHFRVTLTNSIPGFGNVGYIYWQHVQIKKNNDVIPYEPDALTITIRETTAFKKRPISAANLGPTEKTTLNLGRVYGVASYAIEDNHLKVSLTEEFPQFGNTGYIYPPHVLMRRGSRAFDPLPDRIELNVPYFSQRDNPRYYWSTCNVTSIAMVFYYYGVRSKWGGQLEDELLQWCFNYAGEGSQTNHSVLSALIRAYGFKHQFVTTARWSDVKNELINRRPVVIAGYFTATGHILTIIGFNSRGYIVQDPWGDALTGYSYTEGRKLLYPYGYMDEVCGPEGNIWIHTIAQ
jgi:uncharacterized protein YvpB